MHVCFVHPLIFCFDSLSDILEIILSLLGPLFKVEIYFFFFGLEKYKFPPSFPVVSVIRDMGTEFITGSLQHILSIPHLASARSTHSHKPGKVYHSHCHQCCIIFLFTQLLSDYSWGWVGLKKAAQDLTSEKFREQISAPGPRAVFITLLTKRWEVEGWCSECMLMSSTSGETSRNSRSFGRNRRGE